MATTAYRFIVNQGHNYVLRRGLEPLDKYTSWYSNGPVLTIMSRGEWLLPREQIKPIFVYPRFLEYGVLSRLAS